MNSIGIVFIHGAGLYSSIWDNVIKEIDAPFLSVDFPNRDTTNNLNSELRFNDYVDHVTLQVEKWGHSKFIIVAHSIGACVALEVADRFADNVMGFVAIGSVIPLNGSSFTNTLPFPQKIILPIILKLFGTKPPKKTIEKELCNDLTSEQTAMIVDTFIAESKALYTDKISFTLPDTKRVYIMLTDDKSMPISFQENMAKNLSVDKTVNLHSGHLPMISKPIELSTVLKDFI